MTFPPRTQDTFCRFIRIIDSCSACVRTSLVNSLLENFHKNIYLFKPLSCWQFIVCPSWNEHHRSRSPENVLIGCSKPYSRLYRIDLVVLLCGNRVDIKWGWRFVVNCACGDEATVVYGWWQDCVSRDDGRAVRACGSRGSPCDTVTCIPDIFPKRSSISPCVAMEAKKSNGFIDCRVLLYHYLISG